MPPASLIPTSVTTARTRAALAALSLCLALGACVRTQSAPLSQRGDRAELPADSVIVYATAADAPRRHEPVAMLQVQGDWLLANDARLIQALRVEAGRMGANAVVLGARHDPSTASKLGDVLVGNQLAMRRAEALAVWVPTAPLD